MGHGGERGSRGDAGAEKHSQHPVDRLIRELIQTGRQATTEEIERIIERMATAPFDRRVLPVPAQLRGTPYQGRALGTREDALFIHLVQRVIRDGQWAEGITELDYVADLRRAVRAPPARLVIYQRRGGPVAATFTPSDRVLPASRRGPKALPWLYVVYSADRGIIVSGYQTSGLQTLSVPGDARWLR